MEKLLKKAEDAMTGKRYSEALTWLKQAKVLALPDKQKEIDEKMVEVQKKASEGSLFGMEQPSVFHNRNRPGQLYIPDSKRHLPDSRKHNPYNILFPYHKRNRFRNRQFHNRKESSFINRYRCNRHE